MSPSICYGRVLSVLLIVAKLNQPILYNLKCELFFLFQGERATGYGVALLLSLFGGASEDPLLNMVSPLGCNGDSPPEDMERDSKRRRLI